MDFNPSNGERFPYDPEFTKTLEIGARALLFESRIELAMNVFYTDWQDQQVPVATGLFFTTDNAANSELSGLDFSINALLSEEWRMQFAFGYVDTAFKDYRVGDQDFSGNEFVYAPKTTASIGAQWEKAVWSASAGIAYQAKSFTSRANLDSERSEERAVVNAQIGRRFENLQLRLFARNLLDEDYVTATFQFPNGYPGAPGQRGFASYSEPRTYGLQLDYQIP